MRVELTPVTTQGGMNLGEHQMRRNILSALDRNLPPFLGGVAHEGRALIVAGGPSLTETLPELRSLRDKNTRIFAVNGTHDFLIGNGIVPDYHVIADGQAKVAGFVQAPHADIYYLIASQCHPSVFDALEGRKVYLWHSYVDVIDLDQFLADYGQPSAIHPWLVVGGGSSGGLRAFNLAHLMGFRDIHLFGFDSCYQEARHHAYLQDINNANFADLRVVHYGEESFLCPEWMRSQAADFKNILGQPWMEAEITTHGEGLIPWIMKCEQAGEDHQLMVRPQSSIPNST